MIELFRQYWWAAILVAAVIVVVTHAGLVKLITHLEKKPADRPNQD
ncbi:MAG: hypothetical protein K0R03_577 [Moraxellaceae bacterium]|jgi:hypothetical protein|nr:hypothetical protein [Moraxellaceae bacterium]MDF3030019.1 hypothetical protein [Moraxellaceae bacterium]